MRRLIVLAVAAVMAAGCGQGSKGSTATTAQATTTTLPTISGTAELHSADGVLELDDGTCTGTSGYDDLTEGASVTLRDEHGTTIGTSALGPGTLSGAGLSKVCTFPFTITDVPTSAKFYAVEVSHRGAVTYSHDQLAQQGWTVGLTIGS
jgi:hypothetical protein